MQPIQPYGYKISINVQTTTPFYGPLDSVRDYPGEPAPER